MASEDKIKAIPEKVRIDFIEGVHAGIYGPHNIPLEIYLATSEILMEEVFKGFGRTFFEAVNAKDLASLRAFHTNVFLFSGAKTARQAQDLSKAVLDDFGFIRPWKQFKEIALEIDRAYNLNWLKTERNTAFAMAQSAAQWRDIEDVKDIFTHLKYITKEDTHVRDSHKPLNGIIRPVDDSFWDTHFPPVDWNCRCTWEQLMANEVPKRKGRIDKTVEETPNPLFKYNPGKTGFIFGPDHPYFKMLKSYPYLTRLTPPAPTPPAIKPDVSPFDGMDITFAKTIKDALTPDQWEMFDKDILRLLSKEQAGNQARIYFHTDRGEGSHYHGRKNEIRIERFAGKQNLTSGKESKRWENSKYYQRKVIYHEIGHAIHHNHGILDNYGWRRQNMGPYGVTSGELTKAAETFRSVFSKHNNRYKRRSKAGKALWADTYDKFEKYRRLAAKSMFDRNFDWRGSLREMGWGDLEELLPSDWNFKDFNEAMSAYADTVAAFTKESLGWGHGKSYWGKGGPVAASEKETFAHMMEITMEENPVFKWMDPELYKDLQAYGKHLFNEYDIKR